MISLLTAGVLLCSGLTTTYDAHLSINPGARAVHGQLIESDGGASVISFSYAGLDSEDGCLFMDGLEVCVSPDAQEATLWLVVQGVGGDRVESGNLSCHWDGLKR